MLPSTFMRLMIHILRSLIDKCVFAYFDNILVYSTRVDGILVGSRGIKMDEKKVKAIQIWLTPKNMSDVRSFHRLASFCKCFVKVFSTLAAPLNEIIRKDVGFKWEEPQERDRLTHVPILVIPNFHKSFELECDASNIGVKTVLLQEWNLISYFIEKLKVRALHVWQRYLLHEEFMVHSDHESLKHLRR
ncbi:Retrovirus-related Pol polyprotein from transposon 17.6, partial [Mucuna pruriens]